jgi:hypothetical protein
MIERRRSISELLALVERMRINLLRLDGSDNDIVNWIELQNDASRIDVEAAGRRREHQERSH